MIKRSVIIPVYNAFDQAEACLRSVLKHTPEADSIILIDDASPQGKFEAVLTKDLLADPRVSLTRNQQNKGFVKTCNIGMRLARENDVVLLNSDTEVTAGWLRKMSTAAYSRENVATVTPFTNNGVICSLPRFCLDNQLPSFCSLDRFAEIVESASQRTYPELPTCIGFCVYIKRKVLDQIGLLDEEVFGLGYGEENDFSCRAQAAGYVDILDDATFVYHKGNMSFQDAREQLSSKNTEVINKRWPHYFDSVSKFCNRDSLREQRLRVLDQLVVEWNGLKKRRVLQVLQNGPYQSRGEMLGGTERHVQDLIASADHAAYWSLVPSKNCYFLTAHMPGFEREYILDLHRTSLKAIFDSRFFDLIHLHHSRWIDHHELCQALLSHGNYMVSMHDFILVCPRFHLYTPFRKVCDGHECSQSCGYGQEYIDEYRADTIAMLTAARKVVCFSESTRRHVTEIISGDFNWAEQHHGIPNVVEDPGDNQRPPAFSAEQPFKIAFLGFIPQHKGSLIIEELIKNKKLPCGVPLEWHVVGKLFLDAGERVIQHGEYEREELLEKLRVAAPHLVLILSICPETYCLTLDEAWNAGIPAMVTPYGAPAERVAKSGAGWVLPELNSETVLKAVNQLAENPEAYQTACKQVDKLKILTINQEAEHYSKLYREFLADQPSCELSELLQYLKMFGLAKPPERSFFAKLIGKIINVVIYRLDSLQIRGHVQRLACAVLPKRMIEKLKEFALSQAAACHSPRKMQSIQ